MANKSITKAEADAAKKEMFSIMLKKTGMSSVRFYEIARNTFVANNLYLLTPAEKKRYQEIGISL